VGGLRCVDRGRQITGVPTLPLHEGWGPRHAPLHHVTAKRGDWLAPSAAEIAVPTASVEAAAIVSIAIAVSEAAVVEAPVIK
jgi:hypothetical protein